MYCAICNGALDPITDSSLPPDKYDVQKALQFWTMEIHCDNSTIELIENEKLVTTPETLEKLIQDQYVCKQTDTQCKIYIYYFIVIFCLLVLKLAVNTSINLLAKLPVRWPVQHVAVSNLKTCIHFDKVQSKISEDTKHWSL